MQRSCDRIYVLERDYPTYTAAEERALAVRAKARRVDGRLTEDALSARNMLVESQIPWVARVSVEFSRTPFARMARLDTADYVAEAMAALMHAVDAFNPSTGCRLTTYVVSPVRHRLRRLVQQLGFVLPLPNNPPPSRFLTAVIRGSVGDASGLAICDPRDEIAAIDDQDEHDVRLSQVLTTIRQHLSLLDEVALWQWAHGAAYREIARAFGTTRQAAQLRIARIIAKLREFFEKCAGNGGPAGYTWLRKM